MLKTMLDLIQLLSSSLQMVSINDMSAKQFLLALHFTVIECVTLYIHCNLGNI